MPTSYGVQNKLKKYTVTKNCLTLLTIWLNCPSDLKNFANSRPSALNFKSFSRSLEQFLLTVGPNNFGNKLPFLLMHNSHFEKQNKFKHKRDKNFFCNESIKAKKKLYSLLCDAYFEINDDGNVSKGWLDLPLTFVACNHIDEPRHELWGNGTQASSVEWMTSHRDCTCRDEHLKKKEKLIMI